LKCLVVTDGMGGWWRCGDGVVVVEWVAIRRC
jgi:hypothetical protein